MPGTSCKMVKLCKQSQTENEKRKAMQEKKRKNDGKAEHKQKMSECEAKQGNSWIDVLQMSEKRSTDLDVIFLHNLDVQCSRKPGCDFSPQPGCDVSPQPGCAIFSETRM